jgi:hypothetical protein
LNDVYQRHIPFSQLHIAIFHQGRRIQDQETTSFKREALDNLGPISRACADGRL